MTLVHFGQANRYCALRVDELIQNMQESKETV